MAKKNDWIDDEEQEEAAPVAASPRSAVVEDVDEATRLTTDLARYTEEFRDLLGSDTTADATRRQELRGLLRKTRRLLDKLEPIVEIDLPRQPTGQYYNVGDRTFAPGRHRVRAGIAQVLLHAASMAQQAEVRMMRQNGREIDLTNVSQRARNLDIMADN